MIDYVRQCDNDDNAYIHLLVIATIITEYYITTCEHGEA